MDFDEIMDEIRTEETRQAGMAAVSAQKAESAAAQAQPAASAGESRTVRTVSRDPRMEGVKALLFKTPTCPNCKAAGALLDKAGVEYDALNANEEKDLVSVYGVKQAPTLVLVKGDSFEKYRGVSDIKGWLMNK